MVIATIFGVVASLASGSDDNAAAPAPPTSSSVVTTTTATPSTPTTTTKPPPIGIDKSAETSTPQPLPPASTPASQEPKALFNFVCTRTTRTCSFDGTGAFDPDGRVVHWTWNFGDGRKADGIRQSHTYRSAGTYRVTLLITDNTGMTDTALQFLTVR